MSIFKSVKKIFFEGTAVYISSDFMDVAEARLSGAGITLTSIQRFPIGTGQEHSVDGVLDRIFSSEPQTPYRVAVNVRNDQLILRRFAMREIPEKEMAQAIAFAAQQHLPCPIDTLTYGFKTYRRAANSREVIFAAAETKNINELAGYFKRKNILPAVIAPVPFLLSKLVSLNNPSSAGACMLVHYEPNYKVILCGVSRSHPYFFREITVSSDIGPKWGDGFEKASPSLGAVWPHIEEDMIKSMNYLRREAGEKVEKIYISGFSASQDEARVSKELNMPIERHRFPFFASPASEQDDKYLPLLMLVLDSLKKPSLNIAPAEVLRDDIWGVKFIFMKFLAGLGLIAALHMAFSGINAAVSLKVARDAKNFESYGAMHPYRSRADVELYKKSTAESVLFARDILSKRYFFTRKLVFLNRLMPSSAWVENISFAYDKESGGTAFLTIKGAILDFAQGSVTVNKILETLKADKDMMEGFKGAVLSYVENKKSSGRDITEFEISFK